MPQDAPGPGTPSSQGSAVVARFPTGLRGRQTTSGASSWPADASGYDRKSPIGYGAFSTVYKCKVTVGEHCGEDCAVKVINLEEITDSSLQEIRRELQAMKLCRHPNVITYHVAFPHEHAMWLVMPFVSSGSLTLILRDHLPLKPDQKVPWTVTEYESVLAYILGEVARGLQFFHECHTVHRDLKASNILLGYQGEILLSDFGVAASLRECATRTTFVGTPCWMAPEVLLAATEQGYAGGGYNNKCDVWSFGITTIELAEGEAPYQRFAPLKVMKLIIESEPAKLSPNIWSPGLNAVVTSCLQKRPESRPAMQELLRQQHKFFSRANKEPLLRFLSSLTPVEARCPPMPGRADSDGAPAPAFTEEMEFDFDLEEEER
mmetsp:Transcript_40156/g.96257  ORF Transcript_40156/g.96257 Transcript_40156/m.96257 type:complete len:377 (-) Transcript_40156:134-1264(-)